MKGIKSICLLAVVFMVQSCVTYIIPLESYKQQFKGMDSTQLKTVKVTGPLYGTQSYLANPIKKIQCQTKDGKAVTLDNSPSIEMRITYINDKGKKRRKIYYFDRTALIHGTIYGLESRIAGITSRIPADSVRLIEVQDGGKKYRYAE